MIKRKTYILFFSIMICATTLCAQSFGFSASALGFFPTYPDVEVQTGSRERILGHTSSFTPGVRFETNFMHVGTRPAMFGYTGLGVSYFFPHVDSAFYFAQLKTGPTIPVLATSKTTTTNISLRVAYDIPLQLNDFVTFHLGVGIGFIQNKTQFILPEKSNTFNYEQSEFVEKDFIPAKNGDVLMEALAGAMYEFEKFYVLGQYSMILGTSSYPNQRAFRHGITAGIYYPLKRF